jgi:type IV pilus assembly protein PilE
MNRQSSTQIGVHGRRRRARRTVLGFTLIELLVAMVIAAILISIAIPSYINYTRKARRTDAKSALLNMASLEERYFSANNKYSTTATDLGYSAFPVSLSSGSTADYTIATPTTTAATAPTATAPGGTPATYSITATAVGDQVNDVACASFTVTSAGARTATMSGGTDNTSACWN